MTNSLAVPGAALKLSRILAPVDFSENCRRAAHDAEWLARHFNAELVLLHSVPHVSVPFGPAEGFAYSGAADMTSDRVAESAADLEALAMEVHGLTTRRVIVEDDPAHAIMELLTERPCDLVVMPTHGYGALRRFVAGSVTAEVLRRAPCPVWTGCHYDKGPAIPMIHNVLCAVDFSGDPAVVAHWAAGLSHEFGATLHMVHALPASTVRSAGMYLDPDWRNDMALEARRRMGEMLCENADRGRTHVAAGDVPDAIADVAAQVNAGVVVVGRGPKAYSIIRALPCPVVVI